MPFSAFAPSIRISAIGTGARFYQFVAYRFKFLGRFHFHSPVVVLLTLSISKPRARNHSVDL
jgi:hypothetical protein